MSEDTPQNEVPKKRSARRKNGASEATPKEPKDEREVVPQDTLTAGAPTAGTPIAGTPVGINVNLGAFASEDAVPAPPAPPEPEPAPPTQFAWEAPQHFQKLPQDFLIYSPDHCAGRAILSIPLDVIDIPRDKSTIKALVCLLLEPAPVIDADGSIVEARIGQEVLVECGHFIRRLIRAALDPRNVGEVWMRPVGKLTGEGGDTITLWDIRYGKTYPRDKVKRSGR